MKTNQTLRIRSKEGQNGAGSKGVDDALATDNARFTACGAICQFDSEAGRVHLVIVVPSRSLSADNAQDASDRAEPAAYGASDCDGRGADPSVLTFRVIRRRTAGKDSASIRTNRRDRAARSATFGRQCQKLTLLMPRR